jgi:hypothetical protein
MFIKVKFGYFLNYLGEPVLPVEVLRTVISDKAGIICVLLRLHFGN